MSEPLLKDSKQDVETKEMEYPFTFSQQSSE